MTVHVLLHGLTLCGLRWEEAPQGDKWISCSEGLPDGAAMCGVCVRERRERERRPASPLVVEGTR